MSEIRGLPLLSGPPPSVESGDSCRKCDKEFNMFLNRSRKCNHCGYLYCHNCSDYQAMMPRHGQESGYDAMHVCAYCIEFLNITAAGRGKLRTMPLSKLKGYIDAYNIRINRAVEKDDLIDAMLKARGSHGCLTADNENYYRKYSVPNKSTRHARSRFFSGSNQNPSAQRPPPPPPGRPTQNTHFPRPDLEPNAQPYQYGPPPGPPPSRPPPQQQQQQRYQPRTTPPRYTHPPQSRPYRPNPNPGYNQNTHPNYRQPTPSQNHPYTSYQGYPPYQRPAASRSSDHLHRPDVNQTPPRPRAASAAPPAATPIPTLEELLEMPSEVIASLSIGTLKSILFRNHVNAGLILEKSELVMKVKTLVEDEKRDRERQRAQEEAEEAEKIRLQREMMEAHNRAQKEREEKRRAEQQFRAGVQPSGSSMPMDEDVHMSERTPSPPLPPLPHETAAPKTPPQARGTAADLERTGLCVICQDEEANIAIVDCGHLAMCRSCSDLVMASSKECPLCRTRIVTEARLLRIFKT